MIRLIKPHYGRVILAGLLGLCVSGINGTLAWLMKPVIDDVLIKKNLTYLALLPLGIMILFTMRGLFIAGQAYLMKSVGMKIVNNLRNRLYQHLSTLPMSFIKKEASGSIISRFLNDVNLLQDLVARSVKDLFVEGATVIVLTAFAFYKRWDLALAVIIIGPLALYGVQRIGKRLKATVKKSQQKISVLTELLTETLNGFKIIKVFGRQEDMLRIFSEKNQSFYREVMRTVRLSEGATLLMELIGGIAIAFVLWYGGGLVVKGALTPGDLASFVVAVMMIHTPAKRLAGVNNNIQQAKVAFERLSDIFRVEGEKEGGIDIREFRDSIEFRNVTFRYPGTQRIVLDDVNLKIKKGEIIAIVGRSGVGKTTLVDLIPRFYDPDSGKILIDSIDLRDLSLHSLRNLIGIVSQDIILFNDTVRNNIRFAKPDATDEEVIYAAKAAHAHEFIMEFPEKYDTVIGERGTRLSGGQAQRISIARAILKNPPILILDEATSNLDAHSEHAVRMALENLMKHRTVIIIAHRLSTIKNVSRIIVLERGKIIESGTHDELFELNGAYRRLYEHQFVS
ncbi:MAG: ABC transporter ATP-binding protein/permease [Thermodesulfovibrionales bacterium]|nr:ABC transporter ATP-binding protein/permease [Thermodesulfovibrionales bacterium]